MTRYAIARAATDMPEHDELVRSVNTTKLPRSMTWTPWTLKDCVGRHKLQDPGGDRVNHTTLSIQSPFFSGVHQQSACLAGRIAGSPANLCRLHATARGRFGKC